MNNFRSPNKLINKKLADINKQQHNFNSTNTQGLKTVLRNCHEETEERPAKLSAKTEIYQGGKNSELQEMVSGFESAKSDLKIPSSPEILKISPTRWKQEKIHSEDFDIRTDDSSDRTVRDSQRQTRLEVNSNIKLNHHNSGSNSKLLKSLYDQITQHTGASVQPQLSPMNKPSVLQHYTVRKNDKKFNQNKQMEQVPEIPKSLFFTEQKRILVDDQLSLFQSFTPSVNPFDDNRDIGSSMRKQSDCNNSIRQMSNIKNISLLSPNVDFSKYQEPVTPLKQTKEQKSKRRSGAFTSERRLKKERELAKILTKEDTRKFYKLLKKNQLKKPSALNQLKDIIFKGLTDKMRRDLWMQLAVTEELKLQNSEVKYYNELIKITNENSPSFIDIQKDVHRTFSQYDFFLEYQQREQNPLQNVLVAYSQIDQEIGYAQGMNYVAAIFIMILPGEYEAFIALCYVMQVLNWRCVYLNNTPKLQNLLSIVQKKLKSECSKVFQFLMDQDITPEASFSQLFIALGLYNCPLEVSHQIIDLFLLEGEKVLYRIIINCIKMNEKKILGMRDEFDLYNFLSKQMIQQTYTDSGIRSILEEI